MSFQSNNQNLPAELIALSSSLHLGLTTVTHLVEQASAVGWTVSSFSCCPVCITFCRDCLPTDVNDLDFPNTEWADVTNQSE